MSGCPHVATDDARDALWDVPGQERAVAVLRSAAAGGGVGHAWALCGPAGVGQERLARALAAALNCPRDPAPCGACDTCRRCLRGAHPDYWEFHPVGGTHRVGDVREQWLHAASRSPAEGGWKVLRIADADRMNETAANAFLKALEEPPPRTVWLLDIADPDELPDTILSRCRLLRLSPWPAAALEEEARRLGLDDPVDRDLAVRMSDGTPAALARLAAPGGLDDLRRHRSIPRRLREDGPAFALLAARELEGEVKRRTAAIEAEGDEELASLNELYAEAPPRNLVKQITDRTARRRREARLAVLQTALDDLVSWYRDCLLCRAGGDVHAALHRDAAAELRADADVLDSAQLLRAVDAVLATRTALESNVQSHLALEALFLELAALGLVGVR